MAKTLSEMRSIIKSLLSGIGSSVFDFYKNAVRPAPDVPAQPPTPAPVQDRIHQAVGRVITVETPQASEEGMRVLNTLRYQRRVIDESVEMAGSFLQMRLREFVKEIQNQVTGQTESVPMYRAELFTNADERKTEGIRLRLDKELFQGQGQSQTGRSFISNAAGHPATAGMVRGGNIEPKRLWRFDTNVNNRRSRAALRVLEHREGAEVQIDNDTGDTSIYALPGSDERSRNLRSTVKDIVGTAHERDQAVRDMQVAYTERMRGTDYMRFRRQEARAQNLRDYIKQNPGSRLARDSVKAKRGRRAAALKSSVGRTLAVVAAGIMLAVSVLQKILTGVLEQASYLRQQRTAAANYNLSSGQTTRYTLLEKALQLDTGTVSNIFGNLMRFSDPTQPGFVGGLNGAASLLQKDTADLVEWIRGNMHDPEKMMYELLADFLNITATKRGGVMPRTTVSEAFSVNQDLVRQAFGDKFASLFQRMYELFGESDIADHGATFTAAEVQRKAGGVVPKDDGTNQTLLGAAQQGVSALGTLVALWTDIKNSIFNHILAHLSELVAMARNIARTVFGKDNPGFAASENMAAVASAEKDRLRIEGNIAADEAQLRPYMEKAATRFESSTEYATEVLRVVSEKDRAGLQKLGLTRDELFYMVAQNGFLLQNVKKLNELDRNSDVKMGSLTHQTAHTGGTSNVELANGSNELYYALLSWLRDITDSDVNSLFDESVTGKGGLLRYTSPEYVRGTLRTNAGHMKTLGELADNVYAIHAETGIAPRYTSELQRAAKIILKYPAVDMAKEELVSSGIRQEHIQGIIDYAQKVSDYAEGNGNRAEAYRLGNLIYALKNTLDYMGTPGYTHEGNVRAMSMARQAEQESAQKLTAGLIRGEVIPRIMEATGLSKAQAEEAYKAGSQGTVNVSSGSNREVTFHVVIDVPEWKDHLKLSGTVNNDGGLEGVHSLVRGSVVVEGYNPVRDQTR